jgi:hypothetical protein
VLLANCRVGSAYPLGGYATRIDHPREPPQSGFRFVAKWVTSACCCSATDAAQKGQSAPPVADVSARWLLSARKQLPEEGGSRTRPPSHASMARREAAAGVAVTNALRTRLARRRALRLGEKQARSPPPLGPALAVAHSSSLGWRCRAAAPNRGALRLRSVDAERFFGRGNPVACCAPSRLAGHAVLREL